MIGHAFTAPPIRDIVTLPGTAAAGGAFAAEAAIAFILMTTVLAMNNSRRLGRLTGVAAGALVGLFILVEAPVSGMSMNPARTFGSGLLAAEWRSIWVYFTAPLVGMLAAAQLHVVVSGWRVCSAKLHDDHRFCIFHCPQHDGAPREGARAVEAAQRSRGAG